MDIIVTIITTVCRFIMPPCALALVVMCAMNLLKKRKNNFECYAVFKGKRKFAIKNAETFVGSASLSDMRIKGADAHHAMIRAGADGCVISALNDSVVTVNGNEVDTAYVSDADIIGIADTEFRICSGRDIYSSKQSIQSHGVFNISIPFLMLFIYQIALFVSSSFNSAESISKTAACYGAFMLAELIYFIAVKFREDSEIEMLAAFMISTGFAVSAGIGFSTLLKQEISFFIGFAGAIIIYFILRNMKLVNALRIPAAAIGIALFAVNVVFAKTRNGAQNWLSIGSMSFQPSELIKVILVFVCASGLNVMLTKRNTFAFVTFSVISMACLAVIRDFGTLTVYFLVLILVLFMRMCSLKLILAIISSAAVCAVGVVVAFPYVAKRLFSFGHAWQNASGSGFQQTRTLISSASGGLLGLGPGKGLLRKISAATTDMVFGVVTEELGLIVSICSIACFAIFSIYTARRLSKTRCFYYGVTACATSMIFITQASLNVFGSLDMLPFTGVTLPFISCGGSSIMVCTMLLAFIKASRMDSDDTDEIDFNYDDEFEVES